jgi:ribonuclease Z
MPLHIYTPAGTVDEIENLLSGTDTKPNYPVHVHQASTGSTIYESEEYAISAFETAHGTQSVGYALIESDRKGRFDRDKAEELGVPVGPKFQQLHDGTPVKLDDGTVVHPDEVVGDPRPGRKVVYTGDTRPTETVVSAATGADFLIHDAMFAAEQSDRAQYTDHSTAQEAASVASRAEVKRLALTHISSRYANNVAPLEREAVEQFGEHVLLPDDGDSVTVPFPDADSL